MKFKKHIYIFMAIAIMVLGLSGCSSNNEQTQLEKIKNKGVLVVGTSADYPPFEFHKEINGKDTIVGFDIMIAQKIAKELGVKLEVKDMKFDGLLGSLQSNKVDIVLAGMSPTEDRKKAVNFSKEYYNGKNVIVVNKETLKKYKKIDDLKTATIGAQKSSLQENFAKDVIKANNIKSLSKVPDILLELNNKNVDAVVVGENVAKSFLNQYKNLAIANVGELENAGEGSAVAIKKSDDNSLIKEVDKVLNELMQQGKIDEFYDKASQLAQ